MAHYGKHLIVLSKFAERFLRKERDSYPRDLIMKGTKFLKSFRLKAYNELQFLFKYKPAIVSKLILTHSEWFTCCESLGGNHHNT